MSPRAHPVGTEVDVEEQVVAWVGAFSYPAVFCLLVLCGLGLPFSEDLILVTGGWVASRAGGSLPLMMLVAFVGVLVGDSLLYRMGRALGPRVFSHRSLGRVLTPSRLRLLHGLFARRGALAIFLVRFVPGLRAPSFLLAGATGLPYRRFLTADVLGALLFAPAVTWLGFHFGQGALVHLRAGLPWVLLAVAGVGLAMLGVRWVRRRGLGG